MAGFRLYIIFLPLAVAAGCATVNPRPDYDRAVREIQMATGAETGYRPDDGAVIEQEIARRLAHGLSMTGAVEIALLNNPRLQSSFLDLGIARADVVQSGLLSNPTVGISVGFPERGGLAKLEGGLAQNLVDLWQLPVRRRNAEHALERTLLQLAHDAAALVADTRRAYTLAVAAVRAEQIAGENVAIADQLLEAARARQQAGAGTEVDTQLARSQWLEAELALREATMARVQARSELLELLNLDDADESLALSDDLPEPGDWSPDLEYLLSVAAEHRLDLKAADAYALAAAAEVELEKHRVWPMVEVGVDFERSPRGPSRSHGAIARATRAALAGREAEAQGESDEPSLVVGPSLSVEIPLFDQNQAGIARARFAHAQAVIARDALRRTVNRETRLGYERARFAWAQARFYRDELMPLAESSMELAREAYRAGRSPLVSVMESQRTLLTARTGYIAALLEAASALVELERITCRPASAWLTSPAAAQGKNNSSEETPADLSDARSGQTGND